MEQKKQAQTLRSKVDKLALTMGTDALRTRLTGWGYSPEEIEQGVAYFDIRIQRRKNHLRNKEERKNLPPEEMELINARIKKNNSQMQKAHRARIKNMSPEDKEQYYSNKRWDKEEKIRLKEEKIRLKEFQANIKRETLLIEYMLRSDVIFYHHSQEESMRKELEKALNYLKEANTFQEYNPYVWNYQGEGNNYLPLSLIGNLWRATEQFPTIYDVPLDGTYVFYITDSGQRGSGSFNYMKCNKAEAKVVVPFVNPGGIPQITKM